VARRFSDTSQSVVNSKGAITVEQRVEMPDGPHFFHTVKFPLRDSAGNIEAVAGVSFDITKRKLVEQALAREYDLMRALMNQMPDTIYFKDAACRFTRVNAAQAHVLGIADPKQAIGKTDADFFAPDFAREARADDQTVLRTKRPIINKTERVVRLDGHACWMQATKVPVLDSEGNVTGLVGISRETAAPPSAPPSAKILIVEDEANIRDLQSQLLELEGFRVLTARDGVEGLLRFREHAQDIDLVITDLAMPQMTGEVMIAEIRKLSSAVPILVLSGFAKPETQKQLNKCGVSGFISKPFTGDMLLQKIRAVLAAAR
jgi:PAS domain S-box-containing protein